MIDPLQQFSNMYVRRNKESVKIFNQFEKKEFKLNNLFDYVEKNPLKFKLIQDNFAGISFNKPDEGLRLANVHKVNPEKGILYSGIQSFYLFPQALNSNQFHDLFLNDESHPKLEYISFAGYMDVNHFYKKFYKLDKSKKIDESQESKFSNYEGYVLDHVKDLHVDFKEIKLPIEFRNDLKLDDPFYLLFESDLMRIKKYNEKWLK